MGAVFYVTGTIQVEIDDVGIAGSSTAEIIRERLSRFLLLKSDELQGQLGLAPWQVSTRVAVSADIVPDDEASDGAANPEPDDGDD